MRRLSLREVSERTGRSMRRLRALCQEGEYLSAQRDQPRTGWSIGECCVEARERGEWPCPTCSAPVHQHRPAAKKEMYERDEAR